MTTGIFVGSNNAGDLSRRGMAVEDLLEHRAEPREEDKRRALEAVQCPITQLEGVTSLLIDGAQPAIRTEVQQCSSQPGICRGSQRPLPEWLSPILRPQQRYA